VIRTLRVLLPLLTCLGVIWAPALSFPERLRTSNTSPALSRGARAAQNSQSAGKVTTTKAYTPPAGSAERKAIMDGLRGNQKVVFKVYYLKVHGDWAWVDVTPLDDKGRAVAEGGASLMHNDNGGWKVMDLSVIPEDPDNPLGPDDPTPKFVKAVQKAFPEVPADIFPKSARSK
jgi:hypothetical protein